MALASKSVINHARECLQIEQDAIDATRASLDTQFVNVVRAVQSAIEAGRKLIFTGVGKSAHISIKLAGTFNSTGIPSCFLDATQALHGDLGLCAEGDVVILLSNSGQSDEVIKLVTLLKRFGVVIVAFTSNPDSELARHTPLRLLYRVPREACPLGIAPTASTTAALALGDALAMVLLKIRGLTRNDFARFHPAGNLGRILLLRVSDIMRTGDRLPVAPETVTLQDAILRMTKAKSGSIALVSTARKPGGGGGKLTGILTDGDFRRSALTGPDFLQKPVSEFMTRSPKTIRDDALGVDALRVFEQHKIDDLIVVDRSGRPVGLVDGQDLPKLKIV
ncbi:KpsF/GutQ family sugar-phosphate isomerase [Geminisphaera colitermitum]|uniref:KpsF/GutQ family sugar-phosphate isomerase n=1 Tax=Geminisphaera colitermitum TaxID=1148786 RepID=UPI0001965353|nr:KpsF/GutQ family sugar-phosphate isomerase [Geminisphaera colitermitum]RRJ98319.1 KpsF/GutQ family sugar-phosphate isomerase [Opitutaceae bacterium TAV3]